MPLNYRQGFFRGWLALSVLWSIACVIVALYDQHEILEVRQRAVPTNDWGYDWSWLFWSDRIVAFLAP